MTLSQFSKASLLGLVFLLTSCGSNVLSDPLSRDYQTFNGEFKSLGSLRVHSEVTHLFEEDDGTILYAYSDRYDLSEHLNTRLEAYGVVSVYEDLDKPLFEVKRIGEASEEDAEAPAEEVSYKNAALGITFTYTSDWTVVKEGPKETTLEGPMAKEETATLSEEPEDGVMGEETEVPDADQVSFISLDAGLTRTSDEALDLRAAEVRDYVKTYFPDLSGKTGDMIYVGKDRSMGLRYKTETGDVFIFVPRGSELFELSYLNLSGDDATRIANSNSFNSVMVATFRFIPVNEAGEELDTEDDSSSDSDSLQMEMDSDTQNLSTSVEQEVIGKWTTLSSTVFEFTMQIPAAWYYVGGSTGYVFALDPIEDVSDEGVVKMSFNTSTKEGRTSSGDSVSLTKKVDSRTYTLMGSAEYESIMDAMLDSIQTTKAE